MKHQHETGPVVLIQTESLPVGTIRDNRYGKEIIREWWNGKEWMFACLSEGCLERGNIWCITLSNKSYSFCEQHSDEFWKNRESSRFVLYRHFDIHDELLYIGITNEPSARLRQHRKGNWFHQVMKTTYERFSSREELLCAEKDAIVTERPRFNIQHNQVR